MQTLAPSHSGAAPAHAEPAATAASPIKYYNAFEDFLGAVPGSALAQKTAYIDSNHSITYGELHDKAALIGSVLTHLGVRREQRFAMLLLDCVEFPILFMGGIRAGAVPIPLNTLLSAELYAYMLEDSRATVLFVSSALLPVAEAALKLMRQPIPMVVIGASNRGDLPEFSALLNACPHPEPMAATTPDDIAFWLYSSGSTGMPKGVRHVQTSLMQTANLYAKNILGLRRDDIGYSAAKLFFAYGLGNGLSFPLAVGATTILYEGRPTPEAVFGLLKKHQPTIFYGAPTLYAAILADESYNPATGSKKLRFCSSAGEALPEHVGKSWRARFGVDIVDGVGSTEMLHVFLSNRPSDVHYGTSGRPVTGYEARLVDDKGKDVAQGEVGELLIKGPTAAADYWNQREKTRKTFMGEWTATGDKYTQDDAGLYTYCGRTDDMFKVSGIWVSPFEVESALITHPDVLEAAVVAYQDKDELVKPKAYVVLKNASQKPSDQALKDHVKTAIGAWKYPRIIEFVEALPKTATGKIQRFKLR